MIKLIDRPSWDNVVQRGIFSGLAASGEDRVVETLAAYLGNTHLHPTMRLAAGTGMRVLGSNRYLYGEEPRQRAVLNQPFWPTAWYFYICMQHFIYFTRHLL